MSFHLAYALEQWSGKNLLPVDRGLVPTPEASSFAPSRSLMESWSNAPTREDRTRFVPHVSDTGRIAESWSNVRKHEDRARLAIVDIRTGTLTSESWSSVPSHEDRTRIAVANTRLSRRVGRGAFGAVAVATAAVALLVAAPTAWADSGSSGSAPAATDTTTSNQGQSTGTPDATQPSGGQSSGQAGGASATSSADNNSNGSTNASSSSNQSAPTTSAAGTTPLTGTTSAGSSDTSVPQPPTSQGSSNQSSTAAANSDQNGAQNTSATVRTGQGGNDGGVTQGNSDAATAASSTSGGTAPAAGGASANADATATQTSSGNTNIDVRVGSPGNVGPAAQSNDAQAAAGSTGDANAQATQTSPSNVNVVVRVGSPGDNGSVDQKNTVGAIAGPNAPSSISAGATVTPGSTDQSVPTTGDAVGMNDSTTNQQIVQEQGGTAPGVGESPTLISGPVDPATIGSASATQTGASNINVSIRIGSPGSDGPIHQTNGATATGTSPALGVVTTDGGLSSNVTIVIPGDISAPGSNWNWTWTWTSAGTPSMGSTAGTVAPTTGSDWNWAWTPIPGTPTAPAGATPQTAGATQTGMFTWTWTWKKPDGTTSTWTWQQACTCNWTWTWTWDWGSGAPVQAPPADTPNGQPAGTSPVAEQTISSGPAPTVIYDNGAVTQANIAAANARAGAELLTSQTLDQQPGLQGADASQILAVDQQATATAEVSMLDPLNLDLGWGAGSDPVTQANTLEADALAFDHLDATQVLIQQQTASPTTDQAATDQAPTGQAATDQAISGSNWAGGEQIAVATAKADSSSTLNRNVVWAPAANEAHVAAVSQGISGTSTATSVNWESTLQWIQQFENAGTATAQDQEAVNLAAVTQSAISLALTWQAQVTNTNDLLVPAGSRATNPSVSQSAIDSSSATSVNSDQTQQWISQFQNGQSDREGSLAGNDAATAQSNVEGMTASQIDLANRARWLGVEPPAPSPEGPAPLEVVAAQTVAPTPTKLINGRLRGLHTSVQRTAVRSWHVTILRVASSPAGPATVAGSCSTACGGAAPQALAGAVLGAAFTTNVSGASRHATRHPHPAGAASSPPGQNHLPNSAFGAGPSGQAPSSGSSSVAFFTRADKLATPAHIGSHLPAPALGPPVRSPDPFERPG